VADVIGPRIEASERYGWALAPGRSKQVLFAGRFVTYATNADGMRARADTDRIDWARPTIVLVGESFAYGYTLPYEETVQAVVEAGTGLQVVNLSAPGYSNDQSRRWLADVLPRLERPLAVIVFFLPQQIHRNAARPAALRLFEQLPFVYHGDFQREETARVLGATAELVRGRGVPLHFVATNFGPPCAPNAQVYRDLFDAQGFAYTRVDLEPEEDMLPNGHPNGHGAHRLADAIVALVTTRSTPPPP
jgi:hypothetical protein